MQIPTNLRTASVGLLSLACFGEAAFPIYGFDHSLLQSRLLTVHITSPNISGIPAGSKVEWDVKYGAITDWKDRNYRLSGDVVDKSPKSGGSITWDKGYFTAEANEHVLGDVGAWFRRKDPSGDFSWEFHMRWHEEFWSGGATVFGYGTKDEPDMLSAFIFRGNGEVEEIYHPENFNFTYNLGL